MTTRRLPAPWRTDKDTRRRLRRGRCQRPSASPLQPAERSRGSAATIAPERPHCRQSVGAVQQRRQSHLLSAFLAPAFDIYCWQLNCVGILGQRRVCFGKAHHPGRPVAAHRRHEFVATRRLLTVTLLLTNRRHSEPDTICAFYTTAIHYRGYPETLMTWLKMDRRTKPKRCKPPIIATLHHK